MVLIGFLFVLIGCAYGVWRLSAQVPEHRITWSTTWRLACLIAAVRITALWAGLAGLQHSNWLQVAGDLILMLELPDIYIVKAARGEPLRLAILGSVTLAATSFVWSAALLWIANRLSNKSTT